MFRLTACGIAVIGNSRSVTLAKSEELPSVTNAAILRLAMWPGHTEPSNERRNFIRRRSTPGRTYGQESFANAERPNVLSIPVEPHVQGGTPAVHDIRPALAIPLKEQRRGFDLRPVREQVRLIGRHLESIGREQVAEVLAVRRTSRKSR